MKFLLLYIGILSGALGCRPQSFVPEAGDLYFQVTRGSDLSRAIGEVTSGHEGIDFTHVGIVVMRDDTPALLEATTDGGVRIVSVEEFVGSSATLGTEPLVAVYRLQSAAPQVRAAAAERALELVGLPYDYAFLPDNGAYYCSELVWEVYRDDSGRHIFRTAPMTFRPAGEKATSPLWADFFASRGLAVPEGIEGTNPGALSRDERLRCVHRYFGSASGR